MLKKHIVDLHVHTVLSPCAAVEMTPRNIIFNAKIHNINAVAITDHNAGENALSAYKAGILNEVEVLYGIEVETQEEVHILTIFDKLNQFMIFLEYIKESSSRELNDENKLGAQFIVDEEDELISVKKELLLCSLNVSLYDVVSKVKSLGGLVIASHIDRPSYSIISNLGFLPPDLEIDAVEVMRPEYIESLKKEHPWLKNVPIIASSDAHTIDGFINGHKTAFYINKITIDEIKMALNGVNGREMVII